MVATPEEDAADAAELEALRRANPGYKAPQEDKLRTPAERAAAAPTPTTPGVAQFGADNPFLQPLRGAMIGLNQGAIGLAGIPMSALHYGWKGAHWLDPNEVGPAPAWTQATGQGSYGDALTLPDLVPSTEFERTLAAGARTAGTVAPLALMGMGPVAMGTNILGSMGAQELREHGHPTAADVVDVGSGLVTGLGSPARNPFAPASMWSSVGPTIRSPAELEAARMEALRRMEMWSPLTHHMPFGLGVIPNLFLGRISPYAPSAATSAAQRILGIGAGGVAGAQSAVQSPNPPISYAAPGQPSQPPGMTWTPPQ